MTGAYSDRQQAVLQRLAVSRGQLRLALTEHAAARDEDDGAGLFSVLVRQHPLGAAVLALVLGGLATRLRPWRWVLKPALWVALWSALLPVLTPALTAMLAKGSFGGWGELLASFLRRAEPPAAQPASPA